MRLDNLGINAAADPIGRLRVESDAVIFSHDAATPGDGGMHIQANKSEAGDTASLLFQTA